VLVPTSAVKYFTDTEGNRQSVVFVQRDEEPDELPDLDLPTFAPGEKRTYPSQEEGFYPVIVETGLSDTQNVEIISGVEAGESVFINYTVTDSSYAW
jgi:multidrug efflux pump subunit AcrA (membrane-fusion protein)